MQVGSFLIALESASLVSDPAVLAFFRFNPNTMRPPYICIRAKVLNAGKLPDDVPRLHVEAEGATFERSVGNRAGIGFYSGSERYNPNEGQEFILSFSGTTKPEYLVAVSHAQMARLKIPPLR